jgi:mitochondrial protein import protein ZIM17
MSARLHGILRRFAPLTRPTRLLPPVVPRSRICLPAIPGRAAHTIPKPRTPSQPSAAGQPAAPAPSSTHPDNNPNRLKAPTYYLAFTCKPCGTRSAHHVSKQAYHHGSSLVTCPKCQSRHVISDHLGIFGDRKWTVEDILKEKGQLVRRGTLGPDSDIEFWVDERGDLGVDGDAATEGTAKGKAEEAS